MEPSTIGAISQRKSPTQKNICVDVGSAKTAASEAQEQTDGEMSLSTFYPEGTEYFYSFPSGEDSNFFNSELPCMAELIASRPLACTGRKVQCISFYSTTHSIVRDLRYKLELPDIRDDNILSLPREISEDIHGQNRNQLVKEALRRIASPGKLIMAQPFLDPDLTDIYQLPPALVIWLNDKRNIWEFVPSQYIPTRIASFPSGAVFCSDSRPLPIPCVVKVSSSGGGDGVLICRDLSEIANAKQKFRMIKGPVFVEKFIEVRRNFCVHFGIPWSQNSPIEIIGCSEQLTSPSGEFLGGIVYPNVFDPDADAISKILLNDILPNIRSLGWYGVGGIDALLGDDGNFYIIDSNLRMTATMVYLFHVRCGLIAQPLVTFTGEFHGTMQDFERVILPIAKPHYADRNMYIVALSLNGDTFRFNAAMLLDNVESASQRASFLQSLGIQSRVLAGLSTKGL